MSGKIDKYYRIIQYAFYWLIAIIVVAFSFGQLILPAEKEWGDFTRESMNEGWQWELPSGEAGTTDLPAKIKMSGNTSIRLSKTLNELPIDGDCWMSFDTHKQDVTVYVGDEVRYVYNTKETRPYGSDSVRIYTFIRIYKDDLGKSISIQLDGDNNFTGVIPDVCIGTQLGIIRQNIIDYGFETGVALMLIFLGIMCVIVNGVIRIVYGKHVSIGYLGWVVTFIGVWIVAESGIRQFMAPNISILGDMTYISLMTIPISCSMYFDSLQEGRYRKYYLINCVVALVSTVIAIALAITNHIELYKFLGGVFSFIGITIGIYVVTLICDLKSGHSIRYYMEFIGICGVTVAGCLQIIMYITDQEALDGKILCIGLVFLVFMSFDKTFVEARMLENEKIQAVMENKAKEEFLAKMSHEMRTPINAILGMNKMIQKESNQEAVLGYAADVQMATSSLLSLVNEILDFSKAGAGKLDLDIDEYKLMDLVRDEYIMIQSRAEEKNLSLEVKVDENLPEKLLGDRNRIGQVVMNLLTNAVKYTSKGTVTLSVGGQVKGDTLDLRIRVSDTGMGIKEENMDALFESFKRLNEDKVKRIEGTGLGLSITKELVELMCGEISVESVYGSGSAFTVVIPQRILSGQPCGAFDPNQQRDIERAVVEFDNELEGIVLAVDDVAMNLRVIQMLLSDTKIRVDMAKSGEKALEMIKKKKYDIIFLDHMMPVMDGIETRQQMLEMSDSLNKDTPVVMLTANAIVGAREEYLQQGFDDYISKPVEEESLKYVISKYINKENRDEF